MVSLQLGDFILLMSIVALPLGLVAVYLRAIRADNVRFQAAIEIRLERHETRIQTLEGTKVGHTDWVRVVVSQTNRLDTTREMVREMSGKLDASIGLTRQMTRVAQELERQGAVTHGS